MADFRGQPWTVLSTDTLPLQLPYLDTTGQPLNNPVVVEKFRWARTSTLSPTDGDTCVVKDSNNENAFEAVWPEQYHHPQIEIQPGCKAFYGLRVETLSAGRLEIYIK